MAFGDISVILQLAQLHFFINGGGNPAVDEPIFLKGVFGENRVKLFLGKYALIYKFILKQTELPFIRA